MKIKFLNGTEKEISSFPGADLRGADLDRAILIGADLRGVNLCGADIRRANLRGADLRGANLFGSNLAGSDLAKADITGATLPDYNIIPEGDIVVYKKTIRVNEKYTIRILTTLFIGADIKRTSTLVGRKCRAESAKVVSVSYGDYGVSMYNKSIIYKTGETVHSDNYSDDIRIECSHGIHFFMTKQEAIYY